MVLEGRKLRLDNLADVLIPIFEIAFSRFQLASAIG